MNYIRRREDALSRRSDIVTRIMSFIALFAVLFANTVTSAAALEESILEKYAANDIIFYDPEDCQKEATICKQSISGSNLTVIGDSILEDSITKQKLMDKLEGLTNSNYDAVHSRKWEQALEVAKSMSLKSNILFGLGSNNSSPHLQQSDIDELISVVGSDKTIILVTNYATADQYQDGYSANNELFKKNAEKNDKIIVADWASAAAAANATMDSMTVHPNDDAARDLYVETIVGVLTGGGCAGRAVISGVTAAEKVWSGLTSLGFTDEQAAGIMGNMRHESHFNPAQHEGSQYDKYWRMDLSAFSDRAYGLGLIQWSFGRRISMYNYIKEKAPDLLDHFNNPDTYSKKNGSIYGCDGDCYIKLVGDDVANNMYSLQLTYLYDELQNNSSYSGIFQQSSVYDAAKFFLEHVEIPKNPYISYHPDRATDAQAYYDQFHGTTITGSGTQSGTVSGSSSVISTSSSYTEDPNIAGNKNYDGETILTDDLLEKVKVNQSFYEKMVVDTDFPWQIMATIHYLEYSLSRDITHGDALCNSGACSNGLFQAINKQYPIGYVDDSLFVQMGKDVIDDELQSFKSGLNLQDDNDVKKFFFRYNGVADVYKQQARDLGFSEEEAENGEGSPYVMNRYDKDRDPKYNKTTWGQIKQDYGPIEYPANMHFGAYVIFKALGGGSSSGAGYCGYGAGNMNLNQTAIDLAWHKGESGFGGLDPNDNYREALKVVGLTSHSNAEVRRGSSCDAFVTTVYRYSGVDEDFYCCGTTDQHSWLDGNTAEYDHVSPNTTDTSVLEPGDVMILDGHIKMYVEIDGQGYEAQASYGGHSGQIGNPGVSLVDTERGIYQIFRIKNGAAGTRAVVGGGDESTESD